MTHPLRRRLPGRLITAAVALTVVGAAAACTATPSATPSTPPSTPPSSTASSAPASPGSAPGSTPAGALVIDITLAGGSVTPNAKKFDVTVGQTVVLNVTTDHDDQIHVHSEPEVELEVTANQPASTQFTLQQSGSFEVESHHPEKIIAILNVR